ncbi:MAG: hypothetical protein GY944_28215, partial [bacterium]|nr:hypothetical protein [bacterium]
MDGETLSPAELLTRLNKVAGAHGVGRVDLVENRFVGLKSRGVYETPGGTVLHVAHRALESITMDREVMHERDRQAPRYAELIYNGFWFSPEMEVMRAAIDASQRTVSGDVRLKLYKGNDQVRFELTFRALAPEIENIAPWREWDLRSRSDCIEYAKKFDIPIAASIEKPYSMDRNMMHISFEGGILEDPWRAPEEEMFVLTTSPENAPDQGVEIIVGFEQGRPVSIDGETLSPAELLTRLNKVAGAHGVG